MLQLQDVITCCVRLQHPGAADSSPCNILQLQHPLLRTSSAPLQAVVQSTEGARITSCKRPIVMYSNEHPSTEIEEVVGP
jgi:hypothetical protein